MDRPKPFDVKLLFPGKLDPKVAKTLASYFKEVSNEFEPLLQEQIPMTYSKTLPRLETH